MKGLYFIGGIIIGAAGGFIVGKKMTEKRMADMVNNEIDKIREEASSSKEKKVTWAEAVKEYNREAMINKPSVTELAKELHYVQEEASEVDEGEFELISDIDYGEFDDFETVTLYMDNGELINEDSVNPPAIDENLEKYIRGIQDSVDSDSIYIRDGSNMKDYEIIINDSPMEG